MRIVVRVLQGFLLLLLWVAAVTVTGAWLHPSLGLDWQGPVAMAACTVPPLALTWAVARFRRRRERPMLLVRTAWGTSVAWSLVLTAALVLLDPAAARTNLLAQRSWPVAWVTCAGDGGAVDTPGPAKAYGNLVAVLAFGLPES